VHDAVSNGTIENADSYLLPGRDPQDAQEMSGAVIGEANAAVRRYLARFDQQQVHGATIVT
jgi:hypothetical protein